MRIALAQVNVTVGDLKGNQAKIAEFLARARDSKADLVLFPELAVTGYPPEDLLFKPVFIRENLAVLRRLVSLTKGITAVIGFADQDRSGKLYNAAAIAADGRLAGRYHKMMLPNYGVFDEKRYFTPGNSPMVLTLKRSDPVLGISICEDIWVKGGPVQAEAARGARILINLSASPYHAGKRLERERLLARRARSAGGWICYLNLVGGQDELVFDGGSLVVNPQGRVLLRAPQFQEGLYVVEIPASSGSSAQGSWSRSAPALDPDEEIFQALVLGTRDYVMKNGFSRVVLGLSGGIDSAFTAAVAVAALGKERVTGVSMPSRYSSAGTRSDARRVAQALGIDFLEVSIEPIFRAALNSLRALFRGRLPDVTEENLQARIRGTLLMALSNKFHWLVLSTGNKSELSTGYCTLYGDMVGGFAVIKDVPKSWVYRLSRTANRFFGAKVIPDSVFRRPPTAELRPRQRDQETLPPYDQLDRLIRAYVEEDRSAAQVRRRVKLSGRQVGRACRMIDANEYKRRQAPIGIKITPRAFGKDRRMPITNRFFEEG